MSLAVTILEMRFSVLLWVIDMSLRVPQHSVHIPGFGKVDSEHGWLRARKTTMVPEWKAKFPLETNPTGLPHSSCSSSKPPSCFLCQDRRSHQE